MDISQTPGGRGAQVPLGFSPQAQKAAPRRKHGWFWFIALAAVVVAGYLYYRSRSPFESKAASTGARGASLGPISVGVATAVREDVPYYLSGLGSVTPFNTVTVKSRVDGQLLKVYFKEGQFVREGDLLAEIDPRPFQVALEQMEGQLARDQAQLNDARTDQVRYAQLHKEGVVAQQQVDAQNAAVGQLEGAIRADQAQIDNEKLQLVYCKITAPLSGRVGLRLIDQGNMIRATDPNGLVVITQVQPIAVLFTLPEDSLPEVIEHMRREELRVDAYSRDNQVQLASGRLVTVDNQIDPTTGTVRFKAVFDNHDLSLWPNQFVNVRLMLAVRKNAIVIPLPAIQRGTQGTYVYTVKNGHADLRTVKVDLTQGNMSLIASGLAEGEQVVVDGQDKLQAGAPIDAHGTAPETSAAGDPSAPNRSSKTGGSAGARMNGEPTGKAGSDGTPGPGGSAKHQPPEKPGP